MFAVNDTVEYTDKIKDCRPYTWHGQLIVMKVLDGGSLVRVENKWGDKIDELPVFLRPVKGE